MNCKLWIWTPGPNGFCRQCLMKGSAEMYLNMVNGSESTVFLSAAERTIQLVNNITHKVRLNNDNFTHIYTHTFHCSLKNVNTFCFLWCFHNCCKFCRFIYINLEVFKKQQTNQQCLHIVTVFQQNDTFTGFNFLWLFLLFYTPLFIIMFSTNVCSLKHFIVIWKSMINSCTISIFSTFDTIIKKSVTLYFKVSLLQCNYIFKYWVILINYMYLLYGYGLAWGYLHVIMHNSLLL